MYSSSADLFGIWDERGVDYQEYPIIVSNCGYQKFITKNHVTDRPAGRVDYNIIYIVNGKGYFSFDGVPYEVLPGNIFLYPPNVPQQYSFHASDNTELYWMHFSGYAAHDILDRLNLNRKHLFNVGLTPDLVTQYKKIIRELQLKDPAYDYLVSGYLTELLSMFSRRFTFNEDHLNTTEDSSIRDALNVMYSEYNKEYSAKYYADLCNLSLYRFIHKFKEITGVSPLEYITNIRIVEAKYLLRDTSYNITEIAGIVGYDNPLYFSRVFKKYTGISPSEYKKSRNSFSN